MNVRPGQLFHSRYRVVRHLGKGGMATTFLVEDTLFNRHLALKVLRLGSTSAAEAFRWEFARLRGLFHPCLLQVHDFGIERGNGGPLHFYTAEYVEGEPLDRFASGQSWGDVRVPLTDAIRALAFLHHLQVRHGDFKPENTLVRKDGRGVLIDLGCAGHLEAAPSDRISGTKAYLAPELLDGHPSDGRADLFAVGVTIERLLDGLDPKGGPKEIGDLAKRLTDRDPSRRPADAIEVLEALGIRDVHLRPAPTRAPRPYGREDSLAISDTILGSLIDGTNGRRCLYLHGPRGIGRTRLLQEMKWRAELRATVVEGTAASKAPISSLLECAAGGDLPPGLAGVLEGYERLRGKAEPKVLVLDDVQHLDDEQTELFYAFLRTLEAGDPILVLCTDILPPPFSSEVVHIEEIRSLDLSALAEWGAGLVSDAFLADIQRQTGGFPGYVEIILERLATGELHEDELRTAKDLGLELHGIESLSEEDRRSLAAFAVQGHFVEPEVLRALGVSEDSLLRLHRAGWTSPDGPTWKLARGADAAALADTLPENLIRSLHDALARWLVDQQAHGADHTARLVYHLVEAGHTDEAEGILLTHRNAFQSDPQSWQRAAESLLRAEQAPRALLLGAEILEIAGHPDRALAAIEPRLAAGEPWLALAEGQAGACHLKLGDAERAQSHLERSLEFETDESSRAATTGLLARVLIQRGRYEEAALRAQVALEVTDDHRVRAGLHEHLGVAASYLGQWEKARGHFAESTTLHSQAGHPRDYVRVLSHRAINEFRAGKVDDAVRGYRSALEIAERHGLTDQLASTALNLGTACQARGDWGPALTSYQRALRITVAQGKQSTEATLRYNIANLYAQIGLYSRARTAIEGAREAAVRAAMPYLESAINAVEGEIALVRSEPIQAKKLLLQARRGFSKQGLRREVSETDLHLAEVAMAEGDLAAASALIAKVQTSSADVSDLSIRGSLLSGQLLLEKGDGAGAIMVLEEATEIAKELGQRVLKAEVEALLAEAFDLQGSPELAKRHRDRGRRSWERIAASLPKRFRDPFWQQERRASLDRDRTPKPGPERKGPDLRRFLEINARINSTLSVEKVLEHTMDSAVELTGAERGFVLLLSEDGTTFKVPVARNLDRERIGRSYLKFSRSIAEQVVESAEPVLTVDAASDTRFYSNKSVHAMHLKSVLCVPIKSPRGVQGALYLDNRFQQGRFHPDDVDLLVAFGDQVAIALENARLHATLEKRTTELEAEKHRVEELMHGQAEELDRLSEEVRARQNVLEFRYDYDSIIGRSPPMQELLTTLERVIDSDLSVLIQGESGTGKELIARAIHFNSERRKRPFLTLNCAALPSTLLESELFGHIRGAFTGANRDRKGLLVTARGGTVLLDELGEMPLSLQSKMLRVVQEREVLPLGTSETVPIDIRLVAATNRTLRKEVDSGSFREDLYYRLAVVELTVPPLRDRADDIPELVQAFIEAQASRRGRPPPEVSQSVLSALMRFHWPGNVRQLQNVLAKAFVMAGEEPIKVKDLDLPRASVRSMPTLDRKQYEKEEALRLEKALRTARWNVVEVSRKLGIPRSTLYRKLRRYGLHRPS